MIFKKNITIKLCSAILWLFLLLSIPYVAIASNSLTVSVGRSTQKLFSIYENKQIKRFIKTNLTEAFWDAWKTYLRSRSAIKDEKIRTALDTLMTRRAP